MVSHPSQRAFDIILYTTSSYTCFYITATDCNQYDASSPLIGRYLSNLVTHYCEQKSIFHRGLCIKKILTFNKLYLFPFLETTLYVSGGAYIVFFPCMNIVVSKRSSLDLVIKIGPASKYLRFQLLKYYMYVTACNDLFYD